MRHACANPHCADHALVAVTKLACPRCWALLPKPLQDNIVATWAKRDRRAWSGHVLSARVFWSSAARRVEGAEP